MSPYFHFILSLVLAIGTIPSSSADSQLIINTCKENAQSSSSHNANDQVCVSFLQLDPRSLSATPEGLAQISLELLQKKTVAVEAQIKTLLVDSKFDDAIKKGLKDCARIYSDDAKDAVEKALEAFKEKDYATSTFSMSAAITASNDCEDGFSRKPSPLAEVNNEMAQLYGIPLVLIQK